MKRMYSLTGIFAITATAGLAQDQTYDFANFNTIEADAGVEVNVTLGPDYSVTAIAKSGDIADLDITLEGKTLAVTREASSRGWSLFSFGSDTDEFIVTVTMPDVIGLETASGAAVNLTGTTGSLETLDASSGSFIAVADAALDMMRIDVTSGAHVVVSGTCEELAIDTSSGAMVNAGDLRCDAIDVSASSGASVTAFATQSAKADASSGASIHLSGDANVIESETSSGASIIQN